MTLKITHSKTAVIQLPLISPSIQDPLFLKNPLVVFNLVRPGFEKSLLVFFVCKGVSGSFIRLNALVLLSGDKKHVLQLQVLVKHILLHSFHKYVSLLNACRLLQTL